MATEFDKQTYNKIAKLFNEKIAADKSISALKDKIYYGKGTQTDVSKLAELLGVNARDSLLEVLPGAVTNGRLYYNTALETVAPLMDGVCDRINAAAILEQAVEDARAGLSINIIEGSNKATDTLLSSMCASDDVASAINSDVVSTAMKYYDDFQQENLSERSKMGYDQYVTRRYDGVGLHGGKDGCDYCLSRCGTFEYPYDANEVEVFARHPGCKCIITFTTDNDTKILNNYSKRTNSDVFFERHRKQYYQEYLDAAKNATTKKEKQKLWREYEEKRDAYAKHLGLDINKKQVQF